MFDSKEYYIKNREKILKHQKQYQKDNIKKISLRKRKYRKKISKEKRQYVSDYKLSKGCSICGYNKCASALDFHHNGDKNFNISWAVSQFELKDIKKEMDKCMILCANCHRELHACKF